MLGLIFFEPFVKATEMISLSDHIATTIANGHVLFNLLGVVIFIPLVGFFERILNKLIKDKVV